MLTRIYKSSKTVLIAFTSMNSPKKGVRCLFEGINNPETKPTTRRIH